MIPTMDLRAVRLPEHERKAIERDIQRREYERMYEERYAKALQRNRDVRAECFLRGEPEAAPAFVPPRNFAYLY